MVEFSKEKLDKKVYEVLQKYEPQRIEIVVENNRYILRAIFGKDSPLERVVFSVDDTRKEEMDVNVRYITKEKVRSLVKLWMELLGTLSY